MATQFYDVVIVGAGPAGLSCAKTLAGSHLSVLVIDRKDQPGIKACGGGITHLAAGFDLPHDKIRTFEKQTVFLNRLRFTFKLAHPLKTISRDHLAQFQLNELKNAQNIRLLFPVKVLKINQNYLETDRGNFGFTWLVGADGATSKVRKFLDLPSAFRAGFFTEVKLPKPTFFWYVNPRRMGRPTSGYFHTSTIQMWAFTAIRRPFQLLSQMKCSDGF